MIFLTMKLYLKYNTSKKSILQLLSINPINKNTFTKYLVQVYFKERYLLKKKYKLFKRSEERL